MGDERVSADRDAWRSWLAEHHDQRDGVWVVHDRGPRGPDYCGIVEEALCFGWVDSQGRVLDDARTMLSVAPRKRTSGWARTNKARIERLTAEGRMARRRANQWRRPTADPPPP